MILSDPAKFGLVRTEVLPAEGISSGTVYLCSKVRTSAKEQVASKYCAPRHRQCCATSP